MAEKRLAEEDASRQAKKHRHSGSSATSKRRGGTGVDETYGQRSAFGSLDFTTAPDDGEYEWEDETDALAYLKSVREEARGIPHVLAAKKAGPELPEGAVDRSIYQDGRGDFRGFYHDGAYTAYPDNYHEEEEDEDEGDYGAEAGDEGTDPADQADDGELYSDDTSSIAGPRNSNSAEIHQAYYITLIDQYTSLRDLMQAEPPDSVVAALPGDHPSEVKGFGAKWDTFNQWSHRIRNTDPLPAQIALMQKESVLRLLRIILGGKFFRKGQELRERTSRWMWALLARLPEKGELDYQEIGCIRELGKRAIMFMLSLAEAEVLREQYGVGGSGGSEDDAELDADGGIDEEFEQDDIEEAEALDLSQTPQVPEGKARLERPVTTEDFSAPRKANDDISTRAPQAVNQLASPQSDVAMEIESDEEDGEVSTEPKVQSEPAADIEAVKARLLAQLDDIDVPTGEEAPTSPDDDEASRALVNVRATLNMILTIAGEFYGQRDLLEFRDPFGRIVD
ncbi:hypothetical protein JX265_001605 [Neoarthrinium moseri]|uniref:Uncharacterized protein n=1 Tax=Neoarthrinium moseri TaxID=1658444 RepID=A0A9P9WVD2_9PEZI|nr:hypothetical protein JX266_009291 [Neoarthrinium moseri]KAI1879984.1 hypothetical protein JX265_001605 [Neoarthrinium moseri]